MHGCVAEWLAPATVAGRRCLGMMSSFPISLPFFVHDASTNDFSHVKLLSIPIWLLLSPILAASMSFSWSFGYGRRKFSNIQALRMATDFSGRPRYGRHDCWSPRRSCCSAQCFWMKDDSQLRSLSASDDSSPCLPAPSAFELMNAWELGARRDQGDSEEVEQHWIHRLHSQNYTHPSTYMNAPIYTF